MSFAADLVVHPNHFGGATTEATVMRAFTALISLAVNFVGKKFFICGKSELTKSQ
jgi:hypothetical protein